MIQPVLHTERLSLRAFVRSDSGEVQRLANDERIADVTANIPYPYPDGLADEWIDSHLPAWEAGTRAGFAIIQGETGELMGAVSLMHIAEGAAELGYWLGVDYWGQGYATEVCLRVFRFAAEELKLEKVSARVLSRNPASGRVLVKAGMVHSGQSESACGYRNVREPIDNYEIKLA